MKKYFITFILIITFIIPIHAKAYNIIDIKLEDNTKEQIDYQPNLPFYNTNDPTCETIFLNSDGTEKEFKKFLDGVFLLIQISAPVITIVLSIIDYLKSMSTSDTKKLINMLKKI